MAEKFPVIEGAEPFYVSGNNIGVLISHGFMGTPQSVRYIGEKLAMQGYTVLGSRLKGHGTHYKELETCTYRDWFESLERDFLSLRKECTAVFIMGQSMGGTLALWLARKYPEIKGVILINSALSVPAYEEYQGRFYPRYLIEGGPDIKAKNAFEITYEKTPITAIHELQKLMSMTPAILPEIHCPVLAYKSKEDHVVPPENTDYIIQCIGSDKKEAVILKNSFHVASLDHDKDQIVNGAHLFFTQQVSQSVR